MTSLINTLRTKICHKTIKRQIWGAKGVIRRHNSTKDRQYNGQKKKKIQSTKQFKEN